MERKYQELTDLPDLLHPTIRCMKGRVVSVGEAPVVEVSGGLEAGLVVECVDR